LISVAGRTTLVKSVISSQAIYYLTPLFVPPGTLNHIKKLERSFLWSASDKTTGAKCKVNWDLVIRPKKLGGLGVLHLDKFATALRLRWPWLEWKEPHRIGVGKGNPCNRDDMNIFYAATNITVGNGHKTLFWHAPWLHGRKPIDIAPLIYACSKRKNWTICQALSNGAWTKKVVLGPNFTLDHITQFVEL
jgi:hypothetical protein